MSTEPELYGLGKSLSSLLKRTVSISFSVTLLLFLFHGTYKVSRSKFDHLVSFDKLQHYVKTEKAQATKKLALPFINFRTTQKLKD
jgi:hypothetical protein